LNELIEPKTKACLHTNVSRQIINWLNTSMADVNVGGSFANQWLIFQVMVLVDFLFFILQKKITIVFH
jgi:hypothetical protein